jgi:hypothetical protein
MSALQAFIAKVKAAPPDVQAAVAAGNVSRVADRLDALEALFDKLERNPGDVAVELHDVVLEIVNSGGSLKQRLDAVCWLVDHWP